jgi:hypothetical protein
MQEHISKHLAETSTTIIGPDIIFVSSDEALDEQRLYLTGAEIGALFGASVVAFFFIGFCKGLIEGFSEEAGKEVGKKTANSIINKIRRIKNKIWGTKPKAVDQVESKLTSFYVELDSVMLKDFPKVIAKEDMYKYLVKNHTLEVREVNIFLMKSGFPQDKASEYSERIVERLREELFSRISKVD